MTRTDFYSTNPLLLPDSYPAADASAADVPALAPTAPAGGVGERIFVVLFIVISLVGPFVFGECFPFSIAPMFCEQPTCYCRYQVTGPDGSVLPNERFGLKRVYDGNPVGLGCGIQPAKTLDRFGAVPTQDELRAHLQSLPEAWEGLEYVDVRVEVIGDLGRTVGVDSARSFTERVVAPEREQ